MRGIFPLITRFARDQRGALLPDVAKAAIAISFLSVVAANIMSNRIGANEKDVLASIAREAANGRAVDPVATGSLARDANATKIDPCVLQPKR